MTDTDYDLFTSDAWTRVADTADDEAAPALSYENDGGDYRRDNFDASRLFSPQTPDVSELHAGHFANLLWGIAEQVQGWTQFRAGAVGTTASNAVVMGFEQVRAGWEWKVNRVSVSVGGASAAATVELFVGPGLALAVPDESYFVDFASAMFGNSPSRQVSTPVNPYFLTEGDRLIVSIASAAAGSNACFARAEGVRRQKL